MKHGASAGLSELGLLGLLSRKSRFLIVLLALCRNLFCVYSKKHINDVPEEAEMKQKANRRTLSVMCDQLR